MKNKNLISCFTVETSLQAKRFIFEYPGEKPEVQERTAESADFRQLNVPARNKLREYAKNVKNVLQSEEFLDLSGEALEVCIKIQQALDDSTRAESAAGKLQSDKKREARYLATLLKGGYALIKTAKGSGAKLQMPDGQSDVEKIQLSDEEVRLLLWSKLNQDQKTVLNDLIAGYQKAPGVEEKVAAYQKYDEKFKGYAAAYGIPAEYSDRPSDKLFTAENFMDALSYEDLKKLTELANGYKTLPDEKPLKSYREFFMRLCIKYGFVSKAELLTNLDTNALNNRLSKSEQAKETKEKNYKTEKLLTRARDKVKIAIEHFLGPGYPAANRRYLNNLRVEISAYLDNWWNSELNAEEKKLLAAKTIDCGKVNIMEADDGNWGVEINFRAAEKPEVVLIRDKEEVAKEKLRDRAAAKLNDAISYFKYAKKHNEATLIKIVNDYMNDFWQNELDEVERKKLSGSATGAFRVLIDGVEKKVSVRFNNDKGKWLPVQIEM